MKYIIDAYFDLLTDVAVRCKNGVLDMKEHNYSDERISLLAGKTGFMHSKHFTKNVLDMEILKIN